jgi:hypothetical protein
VRVEELANALDRKPLDCNIRTKKPLKGLSSRTF